MSAAHRILAFGFTFALLASLILPAQAAAPERRVLVYTKNQTRTNLYVHDNIAASVVALKKLGADNNFLVDVSDDPAVFTGDNLKKYKALVFDNTNNEIFDTEEQKTALQNYIHAGGGFVGIHSATGSMRKWPWFWALIGGKFKRHAAMQTFTLKVKDATDISTAHLPASFEWTDEFYYVDNIPDGRHVLLVGDLTTVKDAGKAQFPGKAFGDDYPLAWRHEFEGGRAWYTSLGHKKEHYSDPKLSKHILGGIRWAMGDSK
ncbi:MAG: ThuA domain-containing protein [Verrucomicrobia bacterium]|nr:ThuA domain-containing protein [Verrucomicrobiota bacterium]